VNTSERVVALTFDDGTTAAAVDEVLSALASRRLRATFVVNGDHVADAPRVAPRLVAAGHELGNHTYSHERMVLRSQAFIRSQVERTDELRRAAGQQGDIYFRPPFCLKLLGLPRLLWRTGKTTVKWDIDPNWPATASDPGKIVSECMRRRVFSGRCACSMCNDGSETVSPGRHNEPVPPTSGARHRSRLRIEPDVHRQPLAAGSLRPEAKDYACGDPGIK